MGRSSHRIHGSGSEPFEACPDEARCWHDCPLLPSEPEGKGFPCWRVLNAGPLSGYGDSWPEEVVALHEGAEELLTQEARDLLG